MTIRFSLVRHVSIGAFRFALLSLLVVPFFILSCGNSSRNEDQEALDRAAAEFNRADELVRLSAYREVHYPDATPLPSGGFYLVEHHNPSGASIGSGQWIELSYTSFGVDGQLQGSSSRQQARLYGPVSDRTYYAPLITRTMKDLLGTSLYEVLHQAKVGDTLVIGIPSEEMREAHLWPVRPYVSSIVRIAPKRVIVDPEVYERERIEAFLAEPENAGLTPHGNIWREVLSPGSGAVIEGDMRLWVLYAGFFFDGYLFDTNDAGVALRHSLGSIRTQPISVRATEDIRFIAGFSNAFTDLRVGSRVRLLVPSSLAYGQKGRGKVRPFEPLIFEVQIVRND